MRRYLTTAVVIPAAIISAGFLMAGWWGLLIVGNMTFGSLRDPE